MNIACTGSLTLFPKGSSHDCGGLRELGCRVEGVCARALSQSRAHTHTCSAKDDSTLLKMPHDAEFFWARGRLGAQSHCALCQRSEAGASDRIQRQEGEDAR